MKHPIQKKRLTRLLSALLIAALGAPTPSAFALRTLNAGAEESPVRDLLENALQSAAGLEEGEWMAQMRDSLRPLYGDQTDHLSPGDLRILRQARTVDELQRLLGALSVALGIREAGSSSSASEMMASFQIQRFLYPWPPADLGRPGTMLQSYLRAMPSEVSQPLLDFLSSVDREGLVTLEGLDQVKEAIARHVATAEEDDGWALILAPLIEPDFTPALREQIRQEATVVLAAIDPRRAGDEAGRVVSSWMERTLTPNLDGIIRLIDATPGARADRELSLKMLINGISARLVGVFLSQSLGAGLPRWTALSRERVPTDAAFLAKARHEFTHLALEEAGLMGKRFPEDRGTSGAEDWITMISETAFTDPQEMGAGVVFPPTLLGWLRDRGREMASRPTAEWSGRISGSVDRMPLAWRFYAEGTMAAGVAERLAEEILPNGMELEKRSLALQFAGRFVRYSDKPITLDELGLAARAFRAEHGLPEESAAGLEEGDELYLRKAVQGIYQFPDLVEKYFGKDGAQPANWAAFLDAAGRESSWAWDSLGSFWKLPQKTRQRLAYRSLRKLPVPLRLSVGGELVLHNQREGVLLLGENGAEPSLLAIFMTGDYLRGWSRHYPYEWIFSERKYKHTWTYLGGDLLVLEFPQGLYAGRLPRKNGQHKPLTTRFPLEWATEAPVHEGPFEGRVFQTAIEGKDQFVPLKGVVRFSRHELLDVRTASLPLGLKLPESLRKLPAQDLSVDLSQLRWRTDWDKDPEREKAIQSLRGAVRTVEDFFVPQFSAGLEETARAEEKSIVAPVADHLVVGILAHSPGIRELQASLRDSGIQVKEVKNPKESAELLRAELVGLLILSPEDSEAGDWRGGTLVPTVVMPAFVAAGLTEREMAALAAAARARGGILHINDITREGAEEQVLVLRMA